MLENVYRKRSLNVKSESYIEAKIQRLSMDEDDDTWIPPSDAELKIIQARRERSDKISKIMGQYLLRGYKMLNSTCEDCGTILLQDKQQALYCVACSEVDNEHSKDNPALHGSDARRQMEESDHRLSMAHEGEQSTDETSHQFGVNRREQSSSISTTTQHDDNSWIGSAESTLKSTVTSTVHSLTTSQCVDDSIRLCVLIKACAEALIALKSLRNSQ